MTDTQTLILAFGLNMCAARIALVNGDTADCIVSVRAALANANRAKSVPHKAAALRVLNWLHVKARRDATVLA